jgi:large subunit ribosomal protein L17
MVTSLFKYEKIQTTGAKAKELRRWADHLITLAKRGDLHARRQVLAIVREKDVVHKLFEHAAERYGSVSGGYTRIVKLGHRPGDAAPVSLVELIYSQDTKKKTKKKKAKSDAASRKGAVASKPAAGDEKRESAKPKAAKVKTEKASEKKPKAAAKKKTSAEDIAAADAKEPKPEKKAKAAAPAEDADDTEKKKASAKKAPKEDK